MVDQKKTKDKAPDPRDRFVWKAGDIKIIKKGNKDKGKNG